MCPRSHWGCLRAPWLQHGLVGSLAGQNAGLAARERWAVVLDVHSAACMRAPQLQRPAPFWWRRRSTILSALHRLGIGAQKREGWYSANFGLMRAHTMIIMLGFMWGEGVVFGRP